MCASYEQTRCRFAVNSIFLEGLGESFSCSHRHSKKLREERGNRLLLIFCFFFIKEKEKEAAKKKIVLCLNVCIKHIRNFLKEPTLFFFVMIE